MNHPYILQHYKPQDVVSSNRILVSNYQRIFEIFASEQFVEAVFPFFQTQIHLKKQQEKVLKELKAIESERAVFVPVESLQMAFQRYYGDEHTFKLQFELVKAKYLRQFKIEDKPGFEVDVQQFFGVMRDIYMLMIEKKLLRAVILLSFVSYIIHPFTH
jgi:hypothetical protein